MLGVGICLCVLYRAFQHSTRSRIYLVVAVSCWLLQKAHLTYQWLRLNYFNAGRNEASIEHHDQGTLKVDALLLHVTLSRPMKVRYGQYVHISIPTVPHTLIGRLQSHPYLVAWADGDDCKPSSTIALLVQCRSGFSNKLRLCQSPTRLSLHGPYGGSQALELFDKVLFMASGIGIAAHLLAAQRLLQAHNCQTSRVRRISLLWFLDTEGLRKCHQHFITS